LKKFFSFLAIFLLIASVPVFAQSNSDPVPVSVTAVVEYGCSLAISPTSASWASIPVPVTEGDRDEMLPMDEVDPIIVDLSARMTTGHHAELVVETTSFNLDGAPNSWAPILLQMSFTADSQFPVCDFFAPTIGEILSIWTSPNHAFIEHPTLTFFWKNAPAATPGTYTGVLTFQLMDIVI